MVRSALSSQSDGKSLGERVLRCKTVPGSVKELLAFRHHPQLHAARDGYGGAAATGGAGADQLRGPPGAWLEARAAGAAVPKLRVNPERPGRVAEAAAKAVPAAEATACRVAANPLKIQ